MAPGLAKRDLLCLSDDGANSVYVYSFPDAKLQGTLTGLNVIYYRHAREADPSVVAAIRAYCPAGALSLG